MSSYKCGHCFSQKKSKQLKSNASKSYFPTAKQFRESALPQEFSFRPPIIKYILENPSSSHLYQKLIKCCKFFFIKNPILVIDKLEYKYCCEWKYCNLKECNDKCPNKHKHEHEKFEMEKLKDKKIWLSNKIFVSKTLCKYARSNIASDIIPKIYRYDVKFLKLFYQNLSLDDLKFCATGVNECSLACNNVSHGNGEAVLLEDIINLFSGARKLSMEFNYEHYNSVCKSYVDLIDACNSIKKIKLIHIPDISDIPDYFCVSLFYQHLKRSKNCCSIEITTDMDIEGYNAIIDEILETESFEFLPPVIIYPAMNQIKSKRMKEIQATEAAKYH